MEPISPEDVFTNALTFLDYLTHKTISLTHSNSNLTHKHTNNNTEHSYE